MSLNFTAIGHWLATSTSIIGLSVATPTVIGGILGQIPWTDTVLPLIGSLIAILLPQKSTPNAIDTRDTMQELSHAGVSLGRAAHSPAAMAAASAIPAVVTTLRSAYQDYLAATEALATAREEARAEQDRIRVQAAVVPRDPASELRDALADTSVSQASHAAIVPVPVPVSAATATGGLDPVGGLNPFREGLK